MLKSRVTNQGANATPLAFLEEMIRIRTPSRLHFGLIAPAARAGRRFGGVGLMIDRPGIELTLHPAAQWSVHGPLAERAREMLERLKNTYLGTQVQAHRIQIESAAPEHMGLGTGTQLGLALARGLAEAAGLEDTSAEALAPLVGRGLRSAIGTHGFDRGGFLVDGGKADADDIAPLVAWLRFPEEWRVVLILPPWAQGRHGVEERNAFGQIADNPVHAAELCRQVLLEILPALSAGDFATFSESVYQFNRAAGEAFAPVQGGPYASARIAALIEHLRHAGVRGVGQSSWGPAVFALAEDGQMAAWIMEKARFQRSPDAGSMLIAAPANTGADVRRA